MAAPMGPPLGARIRAERLRRGLTVRGLARDIGVSASLISQIETNKSQPSVSTLYAITTALNLPVEELFGARGEAAPAEALVAAAAGESVRVVGADRDRAVGPHVQTAERELIALDSGVTWERLGQVPGRHVDFLLITYASGGTSSSNGGLMRHRGAEYGFLHSGELSLTLGFDEVLLRPGDAISFESTTPHRYRNDGTEPAVGIWFVTGTG
ncbi:MAG: helix-turn-helix domain-containing protein [Actinomycetes bacterium]